MSNTNCPIITSDDILIEILKKVPLWRLQRFRCVSKHWNHLIRSCRPTFSATEEDTLVEILKRTLGKSLTRFRCVSKRWNNLICHPDFVSIHHNHSKTREDSYLFSASTQLKQNFYVISINYGGGSSRAHHQLTIDTSKFGFKNHHQASELINGIFCLFSGYKVLVCNIATGEIVSLPALKRLARKDMFLQPRFYFGFDPVNNEYKVLYVNYKNSLRSVSKVFTVGKSKEWRNIDTLPACNVYVPGGRRFYRSACVNGTICYTTCSTALGGNKNIGLVWFDVKDEKFRVTELPKNLLIGHRAPQVVQFKGHTAIVSRTAGKSINDQLLILDYDDADEIRIHGLETDFKFPSERSYLLISSNSEIRFFVVRDSYLAIRYPEYFGYWTCNHYDEDGIFIGSSDITIGLIDHRLPRGWWELDQATIYEHVEHMYPLKRKLETNASKAIFSEES